MNFPFLSRIILLAAAFFAAAAACAADVPARREVPLRDGWRFFYGNAPDASSPGFDDAKWDAVSVPHTWNVVDATDKNFKRGTGWYRRRFMAPALSNGERVYLEFRGVSLVATVWLNGVQLGAHENGFSAFRFDATAALRAGENTLVVLADSRRRDDLPPREGDFTICGGIYRDVSLLITSAIAIDPLDHGGPGVYLSTPVVTAEKAKLVARILVRNTSDHPQPLQARLALADAAGVPIGEAAVEHVAEAGASEAIVELDVDRPRRWHGRRDPYLYSATASLAIGEKVVDAVVQSVGFRTFRIDPEKGFFLNEQPYDLRGVNLHQESGDSAWVTTPANHEEDFQLMMELGCTFVRFAHYQHPEANYALADRLGIIVWTEHALVNTVSPSPRFAERAATQLRELIRQNFNHPSVVFWGIGNEVQTRIVPAVTLLETLARLVRLEDPGRLSTLATNHNEGVGAYSLDSIAHNQYHGWYHTSVDGFAKWIDAQRAKTPGRSLGMSEYGAGAGISIHRAAPERMDHSEEYQAYFHEAYWRMLRERPWVWCKAIWLMFDFASAGRHEGEKAGINDKGIVSRDRRTRKDAFYWYKANWTDAPMVHVNSRRFTPRTEPVAEVKVYSNCETVELLLNGRSLGAHAVEDHIARWPDVSFSAGENRIEAIGRRGDIEVRDGCSWSYAPLTP